MMSKRMNIDARCEAAGLGSRVSRSPRLLVSQSCSSRHGLAPLELVLALPLLLFMMALMVNFGVIAAWKVRGSSVARFEVLRERHERSGYVYPRDASWWPTAATYGHGADGNVSIDTTVDASTLGGGITVNTSLLDVAQGLMRGHASLNRSYPMLGGMGTFDVSAQTYLVDDKLQFHEVGLASNSARRSRVLYKGWSDGSSEACTEQMNSYISAAESLYYDFYATGGQYTTSLAPLWHDPDFLAYQGSAPDFHPALQSFCTLDTSVVDALEQDLIDRIQGSDDGGSGGVAEHMTQAFISLYQEEMQNYQSQIDSAASGVDTSSWKQNVADLQKEISTLQAFLKKLQNSNGS
jgi:hypothetical protein